MKKFLKSAVGLIEQFIITFFVLCLVFTYLFRIVSVSGDSMLNTLKDGNRVIVNAMDRKVENGDIVVIDLNNAVTFAENETLEICNGLNKTVVKRVVATEGQTIDIDFAAGIVYVDGERLYEDYIELGLTHYDGGAFTGKYPITVPEGYVFIMGDNRSVSMDSRSEKIGFVSVDDITGTVILRFYPDFAFFS
ncbi:MAG: signal peptidase I [Ruminococcus sp.]|nr:signal peptidase I [Ruminococcus sp.]